ncbi:Mth938-like domain-containing protein [Methanohalobium evestigatum]|nr:MTH938/NDUFAF3 family protein [Methanohalobium evestigatum]
MKIDGTEFGSITIDGKKYGHDVVIYPQKIEKRMKEISKNKYGSGHKLCKEEMQEYLKNLDNIDTVVVGNGQNGVLQLLDETEKMLEDKGVEVINRKTPEAINDFNQKIQTKNKVLGIFHVTC